MKKAATFFSFFTLLFFSSFSQNEKNERGLIITSNKDTGSIGQNMALVVGISSYPNIKQLLYADDDAYLFADYLVNEKICAKNNVILLIDSIATKANFFKELKRLLDRAQANDRIFIYFAGHGDVEIEIESGFLLAYDCEKNNYPATDAIDISMLERFVNAFVNKKVKVVLITDACRSGNLAGGISGAGTTISSLAKGFQNVIKILSCQPNQLSQERNYPGGGHGVFTYHLIDGLSGLADKDNDHFISLRELDRYLEEVSIETKQQQIPKIDGDPQVKIASFNDTLKMALIAQKGNNTVVMVNKKRGVSDSIWIGNTYYHAFTEHIRKKRFIEPQGNNAFNTLQEAEKNKQPSALLADLKLELSAVLEDAAQKWINKYLRGELENQENIVLNDLKKAKNYLESVEIMIGEKDLRFTEIHVKKIFFDAFYKLKENDTANSKEALKQLETANKLLPNQAWLLNVTGSFYRELKNYPDAEIAFKKAASLAPNWFYPWNNLGILYRELKNYPEAEKAYRKATQIDSNVVYPYINLGFLYTYYLNDTSKAESAYKKAIQIDSNYADSWNYLGIFYANNYKYSEAEKAYKKAIQIYPDHAYAWQCLGRLYTNSKKYPEAEMAYKKAILIVPAYAYAWGGLYDLYKYYYKKEKAKATYDEAIKIIPNFYDFIYHEKPKELYYH